MEEERIRASETLETARQNKRRSYGGGLNADALEADFVDDDGGYDDNGSIAAIKVTLPKNQNVVHNNYKGPIQENSDKRWEKR